ncbi:hypothetical protein [Methylophaga sp.]|uniref:hypothetical protein n=1 Tax=Methylophaga sp. TaxID=2024840 RepID=UPI003A8DD557
MRKKSSSLTLLLTLISGALAYTGLSQADESVNNGPYCENVSVDYLDDPSLTRAEKLARMEQALSDSLHRFELCNMALSANSSSTNSGNGSGSGSGTDGGGDSGNGNATDGASGTESVASDTMQGTEQAPSNDTTAATAANSQESTESGSGDISASGNIAKNGKIPEDIPPADNDDAIAAQIRVAAEAETDPEIRKKLWDEYRKYKGMNVEH